jgi:ribosomal protein S6
LETVAKRLYEGMFLVDSALAAADWEGTLEVISTILQRADAEVVSMQKWQERKLAYDIDHKTRGTYILCYFNAEGPRIAGIEKDVLLSEKVMRVLVLSTEKRPPEMIERDIKGEPAEKPAEPGASAPAAPAEAPKAAPAEPAASTPAESAEAPKEASAEVVSDSAPAAATPEPEPAASVEEPEKAPE